MGLSAKREAERHGLHQKTPINELGPSLEGSQQRVTSCLPECVSATSGPPQLAADWLHCRNLFDAAAQLLMTAHRLAAGAVPMSSIDAAGADCDAAATAPLDVKPYATMSIDEIMHRTVHRAALRDQIGWARDTMENI